MWTDIECVSLLHIMLERYAWKFTTYTQNTWTLEISPSIPQVPPSTSPLTHHHLPRAPLFITSGLPLQIKVSPLYEFYLLSLLIFLVLNESCFNFFSPWYIIILATQLYFALYKFGAYGYDHLWLLRGIMESMSDARDIRFEVDIASVSNYCLRTRAILRQVSIYSIGSDFRDTFSPSIQLLPTGKIFI